MTWQCRQCGETVPARFDVCWNCGSDREGTPDAAFEAEPRDPSVPEAALEEEDLDSGGPQAGDHASTDADVPCAGQEPADGIRDLWRAVKWPWDWLSRRSPVMIAIVLQVLCVPLLVLFSALSRETASQWADGVWGIAIFLPGAIRRRRAWHMLAMAALGFVAPRVTGWSTLCVDQDAFHLLFWVAWFLWMTVLPAVGEWLLGEGDSWRKLGWTFGLSLAVASWAAGIDYVLSNAAIRRHFVELLGTVLLPAATWLAIVLGSGMAARARKTRVAWGALVAASVLSYVLFFSWGVFELGKRSLAGHGPFTRAFGVVLLEDRGRDSDYQLILEELRRADWTRAYDFTQPHRDWRRTGVTVLMRRNRTWAAEQLAALLLEHPNEELIHLCKGLFAEERRYDTVPILMRYALVEESDGSAIRYVGGDEFTSALLEMRVPQVAHALMLRAGVACRMRDLAAAREELRAPPPWDAERCQVDARLRKSLTRLLGWDAGPIYTDWAAQYEDLVAQAPTPLSGAQRQETDRVVKCFWSYATSSARWEHARSTLAYQTAGKELLALRGEESLALVEDVFSRVAAGERMEVPSPASELGMAMEEWGSLRQAAYDRLAIPEPDWNAPNTDALEEEVRAYSRRVDEAMKKHFPKSEPEAPEINVAPGPLT